MRIISITSQVIMIDNEKQRKERKYKNVTKEKMTNKIISYNTRS